MKRFKKLSIYKIMYVCNVLSLIKTSAIGYDRLRGSLRCASVADFIIQNHFFNDGFLKRIIEYYSNRFNTPSIFLIPQFPFSPHPKIVQLVFWKAVYSREGLSRAEADVHLLSIRNFKHLGIDLRRISCTYTTN